MPDMLIKNGTVVDGTGAPAFAADVRIKDGLIAEVGRDLPSHGERIVDADGCYVAPGFIESHTHYDASMWWQPDHDDFGQLRIFNGSASPVQTSPR
jgi:N-acyl-D-aspartate/D-glutamate deacylase